MPQRAAIWRFGTPLASTCHEGASLVAVPKSGEVRMFVTKTAISDAAAAMLPTLTAYLNAVLIDTIRMEDAAGSTRTRPVRILTEDERSEASHRDLILSFRPGAPTLVPGDMTQPMQIAFGPDDLKLGHALIAEAVRHGGPAVGEPASAKLMRYAARVATSEAAVLIQGDTGVGKEGMARFVHNNSPRAEGPYIAVNCAALPESLFEIEEDSCNFWEGLDLDFSVSG